VQHAPEAAWRTSGLSSSTVHHLHATLHKALKDAERVGLVAGNVCKLVNAPRMAETEIHPLSREDARSFLDVASGERLATARYSCGGHPMGRPPHDA